MAVLNVLIGIPGSGKTTFVQKFLKENDCVLVSTDLVRINNPGILEDLVWPKVYEEIGTNLAQGNDVVFCAPTGTGKTAVAHYIMTKNLNEGKKTIYTTPLKALANDKLREFRKVYGEENVGLLTGDIKLNTKY